MNFFLSFRRELVLGYLSGLVVDVENRLKVLNNLIRCILIR